MALERKRGLRRDTPKSRAWANKRSGLDRSDSQALKRTRIKPVSDKRRAENVERRAVLHDAYGDHPRCALCEPLRAAGIVTGCNGWADDGDEIRRRSAGGSIVDPENVRPVGRFCHRWIGDNPKRARELGLVESRYPDVDG